MYKSRRYISMRYIQKILLSIILVLLAVTGEAKRIDLTEEPIYVRHGFSREWINQMPDGEKWVRVPPGENGERPVRLDKIGFSRFTERPFLSLKKVKPEQFTYVTSFSLSEKDIRDEILGLYLIRINFNWEIYLNGKLLKSEMHLDDTGRIEENRDKLGFTMSIHPRFLKAGENILAFRIIGNPQNTDFGFVLKGPYYLDNYEIILRDSSELFEIILIFLYLFVGLYHIFIFIFRRKESYYLYYGLFSTMLFVYITMRTFFFFNMFSESSIAHRTEFCSLYTLFPLVCAFIDRVIRGRFSRFTAAYSMYSAVLIVLTVLFPMHAAIDLLRIWQITSPLPMIYILYVFISSIIGHTRRFKEEKIARGEKVRFYSGLGRTMIRTVPGNLLIGTVITLFTAVFDILDSLFFHTGVFLTTYGFLFLVIGITFILANRFVEIHNRVESLNIELKKNVDELNLANRRITISEEKYRLLIDGFNELIFSLDTDLNFMLANRTARNQFRLDKKDLESVNFRDLILEDLMEGSMTKQIVMESLDTLIRDRKSVSFKVNLRSKLDNEPREMRVNLQYVDIEGRTEILGRITLPGEDYLARFIEFEKQRIRIGNYLMTADEISHRLTRNLLKYIEQKEITLVRIALREIIINAIEHGNLGISFEEKSQSIEDERYFELLNTRQNDPDNADKVVSIEYLLKPDHVAYKVTDDGSGFDHQGFFRSESGKANQEMLFHGRGINMARNAFDSIEYNRRGNQVLLLKYFR